MQNECLSGFGADQNTRAAFERLATGILIDIRKIEILSCALRCLIQDLPKRASDGPMAPLPNGKRACARCPRRERQAENEGVGFFQHTSA